MANLLLNGILPHNVTTRADYDLTEALVRSTEMPYLVLTDREDQVTSGTVYLTIRNSAEQELIVKAKFQHGHEVHMNPPDIDMKVPAKSEKVVAVAIQCSEAVPTKSPALLQLYWNMGYDLAGKDDLFLSGTQDIPLRPSRIDLIRTVARSLPTLCRSSPQNRNRDSWCAIRLTACSYQFLDGV